MRRTARQLERVAAARSAGRRPRAPPAPLPAGPGREALAMLLRRGLRPRPSRGGLPFPPGLEDAEADAIAARLAHYAFRLFLRGALLAEAPFRPEDATRYLTAAQARRMARELVALGLAAAAPGGRFRLRWPAPNFGATLEWWVGRELARLGFDVATGVRTGAPGVGGDLDVVAAAEGKLVYVELKSSPPKHIAAAELAAFVRRVRALRPDLAVLAVDTALRLGDRVLPMLVAAVGRCAAPARVVRDVWRVAPRLYAVGARYDLIENLRVAVADGLLAAAPEPP